MATPDSDTGQLALGVVEACAADASLLAPIRKRRLRIVCGVDEAGRGPLAGPVYAAAVVLDARRPIEGLADSKVLSAARREELAHSIRLRAKAWCVGMASVAEIDSLNILQASMLAMHRAVTGLGIVPDVAQVDGNRAPAMACTVQTVVGGDALVPAISAASILAKTERDNELRRLHQRYPQYGFDQHKGYGTPLHLERLQLHGVCPEHRRSFAPVRRLLPPQPADASCPEVLALW